MFCVCLFGALRRAEPVFPVLVRLRAAVLVVLVPLLREAVRRVPADVFLFDAVFFVRVLVFFVFANGKYHLFLL